MGNNIKSITAKKGKRNIKDNTEEYERIQRRKMIREKEWKRWIKNHSKNADIGVDTQISTQTHEDDAINQVKEERKAFKQGIKDSAQKKRRRKESAINGKFENYCRRLEAEMAENERKSRYIRAMNRLEEQEDEMAH